MDKIYVIIIILTGIGAAFILSHIRKNKRLRERLISSFGKIPESKSCEFKSISSYYSYKKTNSGKNEVIDSITWDDLDMDLVFKRINACLTSVGEEYLYDALHDIQLNKDILSSREQLISYFENNPDERLNIQMNLARLGKYNYNGIASFIFDAKTKTLKNPLFYNLLSLIPVISLCIIPFNKSAGVMLFILFSICNGFVYYSTKMNIEKELSAIRYFSSILHCCKKIYKGDNSEVHTVFADIAASYKVFKPLETKISGILQKEFSDIAVIAEYIKIIFLYDIRNYNKAVHRILKYTDDFHRMYRCIGEIDMAVCVLSFRKSLPFYSIPEFHDSPEIYFKDLYHPLLSSPVPNTGEIDTSSIVTGSNASGKSTFIKALAINGIMAQTIHTCAAAELGLRFSLIMTSMAVRDNISEGDSYFIKEIKSLKRILDKVHTIPCTCFVDEILKGTNTIERIAASAAVLKYLYSTDCLCVVASHDIELTHILKDKYDNFHFCEHITDDGIYFDYKLKLGPSQTRNAVKLLHYMDFDRSIVEEAESLVDKFVHSNTW